MSARRSALGARRSALGHFNGRPRIDADAFHGRFTRIARCRKKLLYPCEVEEPWILQGAIC
jgi:hypothetical protein